MAILKTKTLKGTGESELKSKLHELRLELMKLNSQRASKSVSNPGKIKEIRRSVAKILTVMNARRESQKGDEGTGKKAGKKAEERTGEKRHAEKVRKSVEKKEKNKKPQKQ